MNKGKKLYEGKAKIIYSTNDKYLVIQHFKDDATAFNNLKKSKVEGKGVLNNRISEYLLTSLAQSGIKTHFVKRLNMREQLIRRAEIIPIEFIVRNVASGSLTKRLGVAEGTVLNKPLLEYCLKNDELQDPVVSKEHIFNFEWATKEEINQIDKMTLRINDLLVGMFRGIGIKLVDFKIEYGKAWNKDAEEKEKDSNQILDFTREVKNISEENKKIIIEALWKIIYSDKDADMYETNLMRRLSGLLYLDPKVVGDIKEKVSQKKYDIFS